MCVNNYTNTNLILVMKQKIYLLALGLLLCLGIQQSYAQSRIQVGVGVANTGINLSYEKMIPSVPNLGIGVYGAYTTRRYGLGLGGLGGLGRYRRNNIDAGVRATYHLNEIFNLSNDKLDLYGAFGLGLRLYTYSDDFVGTGSDIRLGGLGRIGGNYKFSESLSGFGEVGWGPSWITAGIAFDLGR